MSAAGMQDLGARSARARAARLRGVPFGAGPTTRMRSHAVTPIPDPFSARDTLEAGGRSHVIYRLDAVRPGLDRTPYTIKVLLESVLRNCGRGFVDRGRRARPRRAGSRARARHGRDALPAGPRRDAGLHRRPVRRRPRRDARRDERPGRRPGPDQPARAGRPGDRPLGAGRPLRRPRGLRRQRRARVRAQPRALHAPALGAAGVPRLPHRAARHRDRPPGEPGVPVPGRAGAARSTASSWPSPTPWSAPTRTPR